MTKVTAMSTIVILSLTMSRSNSLKLIQWLFLFMENCMEVLLQISMENCRAILEMIKYKEDITWPRVDMNFISS